MARQQLSLKQLAIDKDNTAITIAVGVAVFVTIFSLVASSSLLQQRSYQSRVIKKKQTALTQLKKSAEEVTKLQTAYTAFAESPQNALGGNPSGTGDKDGDNPRLILDALPSKYDFPALTTSLEKVFKDYQIRSIDGSDDEIAQAAVVTSGAPTPVEIPFSITANASASSAQTLLSSYERSIRPFQIQKVSFNTEDSAFKVTVTGKTYVQGTKKFDIKKEIVK